MKDSGFAIVVSGMLAAVMVPVIGQAMRAVPNQAAPATAIEQPVVDRSWPDRSYRVEWDETHIPEEVAASTKIAVAVTVRNNGNRVWPASRYSWRITGSVTNGWWCGTASAPVFHATFAEAVERCCRLAWQHQLNQDPTC